MDKATYDRGLQIRKNVLGNEFVDKAIASADDFNRPMRWTSRPMFRLRRC
jgi:4-carboxymuconolactone decarboxylase